MTLRIVHINLIGLVLQKPAPDPIKHDSESVKKGSYIRNVFGSQSPMISIRFFAGVVSFSFRAVAVAAPKFTICKNFLLYTVHRKRG
jgi:hypothetical protein